MEAASSPLTLRAVLSWHQALALSLQRPPQHTHMKQGTQQPLMAVSHLRIDDDTEKKIQEECVVLCTVYVPTELRRSKGKEENIRFCSKECVFPGHPLARSGDKVASFM